VRVQPRYRLRWIIAGRYDSYIRTWAQTLAAYSRPVRLRFAQEMNGNWYPWSESANGNRSHEFVQAWRHIHDIFVAAGARNVQWIWSPAPITMQREQYPGSAYVTMVSLSMFNGGSQLRYARWRSFAALLARPVALLNTIAPGKPIEISEIGCAEQGGSKAAWITGMFAALRRYPAITSLVWFDLVKGSDWRVESSRNAAAAYATAVAGSALPLTERAGRPRVARPPAQGSRRDGRRPIYPAWDPLVAFDLVRACIRVREARRTGLPVAPASAGGKPRGGVLASPTWFALPRSYGRSRQP